jgi:hypothetical protein
MLSQIGSDTKQILTALIGRYLKAKKKWPAPCMQARLKSMIDPRSLDLRLAPFVPTALPQRAAKSDAQERGLNHFLLTKFTEALSRILAKGLELSASGHGLP